MLRILIVDDEFIERDGIIFLINKFSFDLDIKECSDGEEALNYMKENPIDILFTDVKMPFMDGLELSRNAKILYPNLKIVIFSGFGEFEYAKKAISLGVSNYILKPINQIEFKNTIEEVIEEVKKYNKERQKKEIRILSEKEQIVLKESVNDRHEIDLVKTYIYENYGSDLSLERLAEYIYMTPSYLSSIFKKATGMGINSFIKNYRMEKAKDMLENTNIKIKNIGNFVGYSNTSYFCQSFKEFYGLTPEKYRQRDEANE